MSAIAYRLIRAAGEPSNLLVVIAFSLAGLVLTFTAIRFGLDFGPGTTG